MRPSAAPSPPTGDPDGRTREVRDRTQESAPAPPAAEAVLVPGMRVQRYELIRELGRGGMGRVFLARDTRLGRRVAIKFIRFQSREFTQRFVVEARTTAACHHENIVVVHEVDVFAGIPFIVLEYLEGQPLRALLVGPLPAHRVAELLIPVVKALCCAHERGVIHRDLKPDNIFVTTKGIVKVLDFGIAKVGEELQQDFSDTLDGESSGLDGDYIEPTGREHNGTAAFMSPEQYGAGTVDERSDIWALGVVAFSMLAGRHPLDPPYDQRHVREVLTNPGPMPSIRRYASQAPAALQAIVDRCLQKDPDQRWPNTEALLAALEPLAGSRRLRHLEEGENPFPGLSCFVEADAHRFFGRDKEILQLGTRLRRQPIVGVLGPSGVGKSSFIRAGVLPWLKRSGEGWEVLTMRPGRQPLRALAATIRGAIEETEGEGLEDRIRAEPGVVGAMLREYALMTGTSFMIFVDQFEELFTLCADAEERGAFLSVLAGTGDDASAPLRVVVAMRADFLDRVAESPVFADELLRGAMLLPPPGPEQLREALTQPLDLAGYRFEDASIVDEMLESLAATHGALPLLQFTAAALWEARDPAERLLTRASYKALGGVEGALAAHADEVIGRLSPTKQRLVRQILVRLVTAERTRAVVDATEFDHLGPDPSEVQALIEYLAQERLLVVQRQGEDEHATVEIVHESLIVSWPTFRRWLDASHEETAFFGQLRVVAKQWEARGRPKGLLWTGEAVADARRFLERSPQQFSKREREYVHAACGLADRAARIKRNIVIVTIASLLAIVAAGGVALTTIRQAERDAAAQATVARSEAERARTAEEELGRKLEMLTEAQDARAVAHGKAKAALKVSERERSRAETQSERARVERERAQKESLRAQSERRRAEQESRNAAAASARVQEVNARLEQVLEAERARIQELEREREKIITRLR